MILLIFNTFKINKKYTKPQKHKKNNIKYNIHKSRNSREQRQQKQLEKSTKHQETQKNTIDFREKRLINPAKAEYLEKGF